jgi:hypothetical protein
MSGKSERSNWQQHLDRFVLRRVAFVMGILVASISVIGTHMSEPWDSPSVLIKAYGLQLVLFLLSLVLIKYATKKG